MSDIKIHKTPRIIHTHDAFGGMHYALDIAPHVGLSDDKMAQHHNELATRVDELENAVRQIAFVLGYGLEGLKEP